MPKATHSYHLRRPFSLSLVPVYAVSLLLIFHTLVIAYINSSFLEQFIAASSVGTIYTLGSALSVMIFLFVSRVLRALGNFKFTFSLALLDFGAVLGMAFANSYEIAIPLFLIHIIAVPLIIFNIDVFMEERIGTSEGSTGTKRGLLLALASIIGAFSPLVGGFFIDTTTSDFSIVYIISACTMVPVIMLLLLFFKDFSDPDYTEVKVFDAIRSFWVKVNIRNVLICQLTLQMFFVLMVIYTPLYLTGTIGISWAEFGIIMFFAQLAYIIFEYPVGYLADKFIGEKEMMGLGFFILIISTSWIAFIPSSSVVIWSIVMFTTRVGASLVEATTESYFFKQTKGTDAQVISFFRVTRPLSYVVGALLASLALLYLPFNLLFIATAILMVPALFLTLDITDTK